MDLNKIKEIAATLDPATVQSFVHAVRLVIDATVDEVQAAASSQTPEPIDYAHAKPNHSSPAGGWINAKEVRAAGVRMNEAIAAEKWADGFVFAIQALAAVGAI